MLIDEEKYFKELKDFEHLIEENKQNCVKDI